MDVASPTAAAPTQPPAPVTAKVAWTHEMDVALLQRCQSDGPSAATFEKYVGTFPTAFSTCGEMSKSVKTVEERLLFLMEKLEAMQEDGETSDSTEEDDEEEEEEEDD